MMAINYLWRPAKESWRTIISREKPFLEISGDISKSFEIKYSMSKQKALKKEAKKQAADSEPLTKQDKRFLLAGTGMVIADLVLAILTENTMWGPDFSSELKRIDLFDISTIVELPFGEAEESTMKIFIDYPSYVVNKSAIYANKAKPPRITTTSNAKISETVSVNYDALYANLPRKTADQLKQWYERQSE